jgi:hypothetical protein
MYMMSLLGSPPFPDAAIMNGTWYLNATHYLNEAYLLPDNGQIIYICPECGDYADTIGE